jgi:hypothetical protein
MTIMIVDWLYFQRPGVSLNWYTFRVFGVERLWTTIWQLINVRWMTHSAPTHCISLLFLRHNGASIQRVKVDDATSSHVLPHQTSCISLQFHLTHMCSLFQKVLFRIRSLYNYRRHFIQKFLVRTSTLMQWKCANSTDNVCYNYGDVMFPSHKRVINPVNRKAYHIYFGCQIWDLKNVRPHT